MTPTPELDAATRQRAFDLLEAVLLFHAGASWSPANQRRWLEIIGDAEVTSRALCDAIRDFKSQNQEPK